MYLVWIFSSRTSLFMSEMFFVFHVRESSSVSLLLGFVILYLLKTCNGVFPLFLRCGLSIVFICLAYSLWEANQKLREQWKLGSKFKSFLLS